MTILVYDFGPPLPGDTALSATGSSQADALPIKKRGNVFTTVASGTGAVLPSSFAAGARIEICNRGSNALLVYPSEGDQIESYGVNQPVQVAVGGNAYFTCYDPPLSAVSRTWWLT